jgi:hypothetical protein
MAGRMKRPREETDSTRMFGLTHRSGVIAVRSVRVAKGASKSHGRTALKLWAGKAMDLRDIREPPADILLARKSSRRLPSIERSRTDSFPYRAVGLSIGLLKDIKPSGLQLSYPNSSASDESRRIAIFPENPRVRSWHQGDGGVRGGAAVPTRRSANGTSERSPAGSTRAPERRAAQ